ncbi:restriction endonuclease subunit S [Paenibacillus illinoisensis]|uniref:Type I restriction-modification system specificity subunit n=1 Tax=Paenibacillus illinoisensis TaxID=59845 RepID=A0A2W0CQ41_9BACL|nr:restriction endonuclease subunit S [Paenibacillus illinoisensis]PYY29768.1 Type I restriction-modification system specificity subunit [Paenibacillus illinoisensis]
MKLEDIVTVRVGKNLSRGNEKNDETLVAYSYGDLVNDLEGSFLDFQTNLYQEHTDGYLCSTGDVVFSFVSSKAGIVSELNQGKIINQNFAKLILDQEILDPCYLCYALNESYNVKKQMAIAMQGSIVPKLTPAILKGFEIKLPTMQKQQTIGKAYFTLKKYHALVRKQAELEELVLFQILNQLDQQQ